MLVEVTRTVSVEAVSLDGLVEVTRTVSVSVEAVSPGSEDRGDASVVE
jgi:hypothetical protein